MSEPVESQEVRRERIQARKRRRMMAAAQAADTSPVQVVTPPLDNDPDVQVTSSRPVPVQDSPASSGTVLNSTTPRKHRWEARQQQFEANLQGKDPSVQASLRQYMSRVIEFGRTLSQKRRENRNAKSQLAESREKHTIEMFIDETRNRICDIEEYVAGIYKDLLNGILPPSPERMIEEVNTRIYQLNVFEQQCSMKIFELQDTRRRVEASRAGSFYGPRNPQYFPSQTVRRPPISPHTDQEHDPYGSSSFGEHRSSIQFPGRPDMGPESFGARGYGYSRGPGGPVGSTPTQGGAGTASAVWGEEDIERLIDHTHTEIPAVDMPPEMNISILEHQRQGLAWLLHQESSTNKGGILADDMGLGKTVQTISLIYANPPGPDVLEKDSATLIICPLALIDTWVSDLRERVHPEHRHMVYVHHPRHNSPPNSMASVCRNHQVVVTTYETLAGEYKAMGSRARRHPLYDVHWHRIVLDEAHLIKNHKAIRSMATEGLQATYRLCLSGTPMQNNLAELWPLLRFLRVKPYFDNLGEFKKILPPKEMASQEMSNAARDERWKKLHVLLASILLRRTKDTEINGAKILANLPAKTSFEINLEMEPAEKESYSKFEHGIMDSAERYMDSGDSDTFSYILVLLLRLRQRSCHPYLPKITSKPWKMIPTTVTVEMVRNAQGLSPEAVQTAIGIRVKFNEDEEEVKAEYDADADRCCVACNEIFDKNTTLVLDPCGHHVCPICIKTLHGNSQGDDEVGKCPKCRVSVAMHGIPLLLVEIIQLNSDSSVEEIQTLYNDVQKSKRQIIRAAESEQEERLNNLRQSLHSRTRMDFSMFDEEDNGGPGGFESPRNGEDSKALVALDSNGASPKLEAGPDGDAAEDSAGNPRPEGFHFEKGLFAGQGGTPDKFGSIHLKLKAQDLQVVGKRYEQTEIDQLARLFHRSTCFEDGWVNSSKCSAVVETLFDIWEEAPSDKVIIFSLFTSFLDLLTIPLDAARVKYVMYTGELDIEERNQALKKFSEGDDKVLLISLKAGNVGLTLTAANRVFIVEPFWNPYVEDQAKDRVHRIGQYKKVKVYRFICRDTVEQRITELQSNKRSLIESALDKNARDNVMSLTREAVGYLLGLRRNPQRPRITEQS